MRASLLLSLFWLSGCGLRAVGNRPPPGGDDLSSMLAWLIAAAIVGTGICVACAIWLPNKITAFGGAAACLTVLVLSVGLKVLQPYLLWCVVVCAVIAVVVVVVGVVKLKLLNKLAVLFGVDMTAATTPAQTELVKQTHGAVQKLLGVQPAMKRVIAKVKPNVSP